MEITELSGKTVSVLDGAASENGRVWGCYIHGLFGNDHLRQAWLEDLGWTETEGVQINPYAASLTRLADTLEASLDMEFLEKIIWED